MGVQEPKVNGVQRAPAAMGSPAEGTQQAADLARKRLVALLARVAAQDRLAFRDLYNATSAKLYGIVLRILRDEERARDILQEVYTKVWQRAGSFDASVSSPITWMAVIARNRALDELRKVAPPHDAIDDVAELPSAFIDPLDARARSEELQRLLACLSALTEERRRMVLLAYYHGSSREALSKTFSRPVPTIKTLLHRSLAQVRECMSR